MKKALFIISSVLFLYSCKNGNKNEEQTTTADTTQTQQLDPQKQLVGEWQNTVLKVTVNTARNTDSTGIVDVNEQNWADVLKTKPIKMSFTEDGTFNTEYRNLKDEMINGGSGNWYIVNDTLVMNQKQPDIVSTFYKVAFSNEGTVELSGVVDWEGDGKVDDNYMGVLKNISTAK
ncbi:MAG: hypothetical protein J0M08_07550 [Bacteroidetes bacterium]|nr:hypothetical protein [Bacteroidota bacterium]